MTRKEIGQAFESIVEAIHYLLLAAALWLVFGPGPALADTVIVAALWVWGGLWFAAAYLGISYAVMAEPGRRVSKMAADRWRAGRSLWIWAHRVNLFAALAALLWSGRPALAALWFLAFLFSRAFVNIHLIEDPHFLGETTQNDDQTLAENLRDAAIVLFILAAFLLWIALSLPIIVATIPLMLIFLVVTLVENPAALKGLAWCAHDFRKTEDMPEGMIYFVYSEPHQRAHFMDEPGVLAPFDKWLVARNWRTDLSPRPKYSDGTPEALLLRHYKISNLSKDLPFIAIIDRHERVKAFHCNEAYRARERDATALAALEDRIRAAAVKVFGS